MTEEQKAHWIEDEHTRRRFWAYVRGDLGLSKDEVHAALAVASVKDYTGTPAEAKADVDKFAIIKLGDLAQRLPESPVLAWTEFTSRAGLRWTVSVRGGLPAGLAALGLQQLEAQMDAVEALAQRRNGSAERTQRRRLAASAPPPPEPPTPPAQSGAPNPAPQAQAPGGNGGEEAIKSGTADLEAIKVDADGRVEFHVGGFRWPFKDTRGGEVVAGLFDPGLGWTPAHFKPGTKYDSDAVAGLKVYWEKPGKYYDVVRVHK